MSISTSFTGTADQVKEQAAKFGQQFESTDGENDLTRAHRRQSAAATAAVEKLVEGKDDSTFSISVSGSETEGGSSYLNLSYSETKGAGQTTGSPS